MQPRADGGESVHARPAIDLSEEVFAEAPVTDAPESEGAVPEPAAGYDEPEAEAEQPTAEATPEAPAEEE